MNRRSTPGAGQWLTVGIIVATAIFLLIKLFQYANQRGNYPTGLMVAGIDIGGLNEDQARELLTNRYLEAPVVLYREEERFELSPAQAKFQLDLDGMLSQAEFERTQQDFWAGFWGFLWGRPVEVDPVPIQATHDRLALLAVLEDIRTLMDTPAQPPQVIPSNFSFDYGEPGIQTDIEASFSDIEAALYRPANREARLIIKPGEVQRPEMNLLTRLLVNSLQDFEQTTDGVTSMFILDLETGDEIPINADMAMTGMDLLKVSIVLETYRVLDRDPTIQQRQLISDTLVTGQDNTAANELLKIVAGQDDPYLGAEVVTESMQRLGLVNTFIQLPYDAEPRAGMVPLETPANSVENLLTDPNPYIQTTAEDMGTLLSMIYYCAKGMGGTLTAVYGDSLTQKECETILAFMQQNKIGSLIEEGVPPDVTIAHRHGWTSDTHGDAAIVESPGGDYVIVLLFYKPGWLEWELSAPLIADMSRATYNYFNFDAPYLTDSQAN